MSVGSQSVTILPGEKYAWVDGALKKSAIAVGQNEGDWAEVSLTLTIFL